MKIFLLGAAGNAGQRILRAALARAHEVTAMVRDEAKLPSSPNLRVTRGIVDKSPDLARVMVGHDVVINAAGNVAEASAFTKLVQTVIDATTASLGEMVGSGCSAVRHCSPCRALGSWPSTCPESRGSTRLTAPTWLHF